jgi:hypothetical protein
MFDAAILPLQRRLMPACRGAGPARRAGRPDHDRGLVIGLLAAGAAALGLSALALIGLSSTGWPMGSTGRSRD